MTTQTTETAPSPAIPEAATKREVVKITDKMLRMASRAICQGLTGRTREWEYYIVHARAALEAALPHLVQAAPPPAAPTETLDSVLAEIEAMGWDWQIDRTDDRTREKYRGIASDHNYRQSVGVPGETALATAIALRDAIAAAQRPQEG